MNRPQGVGWIKPIPNEVPHIRAELILEVEFEDGGRARGSVSHFMWVNPDRKISWYRVAAWVDSKKDMVNHPPHYTQGSVECIDAIESALGTEGYIAFLRGQVVKYIWRLGLKDSGLQEAKKALWYLERLTKVLDKGENHDK